MALHLRPSPPPPPFLRRCPPPPHIRFTFSRSHRPLRPLSASATPADPFVTWFHRAWPYVRAHRGSTFVVLISGGIVDGPYLDGALRDLALLHGLGVRLVVVPATNAVIERALRERGREGEFVGPYRVTDDVALEAATEAAGWVRQVVEARLSPGPEMMGLRRHGDCRRWHDVGVSVASGNFLAAKRRGIVEGVDFGATGEVKKVDISRIRERLDRDCIVIVSNLGYSSSGHILNCNSYEVATACALAIEADKLICMIDGQILDENGQLLPFVNLRDADLMIRKRSGNCETAANYVKAVGEEFNYLGYTCLGKSEHVLWGKEDWTEGFRATFNNGVGFDNGNGFWNKALGFPVGGMQRLNKCEGYISELAAAVFVCRGGVQRVHLVDGTLGGALLLELFTRDGVGTMVASDSYEGIRAATEMDLHGIRQLIQSIEKCGTLVPQSIQELNEVLDSFIVLERDGSIIACVALFPYFRESCGEVASFVVSPDLHGFGKEQKLLDYIEKKATMLGLKTLFFVTAITADWSVECGFEESNIENIPRRRLEQINLSKGSKCYKKNLRHVPVDTTADNCASTSF